MIPSKSNLYRMSTLKEISQEHMSNMSEQFFKHFVENYNGRTFTMDDVVNVCAYLLPSFDTHLNFAFSK